MSARILRRIAAGAAAITGCAALVGLAAPAPAAPPAEPGAPPAATAAPVDVQLLSLTDFHGYIRPHNDTGNGTVPGPGGTPIVVGGAAYLSTHWQRLEWPENSIQFAVGDTFSGWPTEVAYHADEPTVEFLNYLGIDFDTVGNHELDISKSFLIDHMWRGECFGKVNVDSCFTNSAGKRFSGSNFGYSTANIVDRKNNQPIVPPYVIKYVKAADGGRIPVGIINLTTDTTVKGSTSYQPELEDLSLVETANTYAAKLQRMGVQTIVVSAHEGLSAGGQYWRCSDAPFGPMADFAKTASPAIDVIVTGHWHTQFNCTIPDPAGNPRPVVEAGFHGKLINEIQLKVDPRTKDVIRSETKSVNHPVTRDVAPDPKVVRQVDYWVERGEQTYARNVGQITGTIDRTADATGQSTLGNLAADALYEDSQRVNRSQAGKAADLALVSTKPHSGSTALRADLSYAAGPNPADRDGRVLFGESWSAFGYANPVLTATVSGQQIHDALEDQWRPQTDGTERFAPLAVSSNVKYSYDPSRPIGDRVDPAEVIVNGQPLDPARDYRLAALAYTLIGGDGTTAFTGKIRDEVRGTRDYEAFRGYLTRHSPLAPPKLDRVIQE